MRQGGQLNYGEVQNHIFGDWLNVTQIHADFQSCTPEAYMLCDLALIKLIKKNKI